MWEEEKCWQCLKGTHEELLENVEPLALVVFVEAIHRRVLAEKAPLTIPTFGSCLDLVKEGMVVCIRVLVCCDMSGLPLFER